MKIKKCGFTVVEIIIVVCLTVVVLGIIGTIFITGNKIFSNSDIKSTLQMEAQESQEKMCKIGMQAEGIEQVTNYNDASGEVNTIEINSYDDDGNKVKYIIKKQRVVNDESYRDGQDRYELYLNDKLISRNLESLKVYDLNNDCLDVDNLENSSGVIFNIVFRKEQGYDNEIYPVNFNIMFRNKV